MPVGELSCAYCCRRAPTSIHSLLGGDNEGKRGATYLPRLNLVALPVTINTRARSPSCDLCDLCS